MIQRIPAFLLVGILLGIPGPAQGQSPDFGLTVGLNLATLDAPNGDLGVRQLPAGGAVVSIDVLGPLSVQSQLLLEQKGAVVGTAPDAIRYGATYGDLYLLVQLEGPALGSVTPYGLVGGFGGVKVFETQRAGTSGLSVALDTETSFFRRTNAGATGGIGGIIPIGGDRRLNLVLRYSHGFLNVARSIDRQPFQQAPFPSEAQTRTWSLMLRLGL